MGNFHVYKEQLENEFQQPLKDILTGVYIDEDLGPSMAAKKLGIPRQAFIYYRNFYGLREMKHQDLTKEFH